MGEEDRIGYVHVWRKLLDSRVWNSAELLKVWMWCLLKASHSQQWFPVDTGKGTTEVFLDKGQFIFGRNSASKELKQKPTTTYKRMLKLKSIGNIDIKSDTHYSIVTICNWSIYQSTEHKKEQAKCQASDNQVTGKEQASDTYNNVDNGNHAENAEKNSLVPISKKKKLEHSPDDYRLAELLSELMTSNNPSRKPTSQAQLNQWANCCRLMREQDKRTIEDIEAHIRWSQADEFWKANILSINKLRIKYDALTLKIKVSQSEKEVHDGGIERW
jgi:hypothetical protein